MTDAEPIAAIAFQTPLNTLSESSIITAVFGIDITLFFSWYPDAKEKKNYFLYSELKN